MAFLKKLFSKQSDRNPSNATPSSTGNPANDPDMIKIFDAYRREMYITRQNWLEKVLPGSIEQNWNKPEKLSGLIIQSLGDGFFKEMVKPAEHLFEIDQDHERATTLLGIIYLKTKRVGDSERILQQHIEKYGESDVVLTNLAKAYSELGDDQRSLKTLFRGLQLDPNQDNALGWYMAIQREKGGEEAELEALAQIADLHGSWRAQLWLAREALKRHNLSRALNLYEQSLAASPSPTPSDLLMQLSGDLGNSGCLSELIDLTLPRFNIEFHGLLVGNNIIKASLDLGLPEKAQQILNQLYAQNRPDWKQTLEFWDTGIAKAKLTLAQDKSKDNITVNMLSIKGARLAKT